MGETNHPPPGDMSEVNRVHRERNPPIPRPTPPGQAEIFLWLPTRPLSMKVSNHTNHHRNRDRNNNRLPRRQLEVTIQATYATSPSIVGHGEATRRRRT